ncbi:hypothetical protein FRC12_003948 [Ceratobasidium sp. 428]|nr:hypothetical protein FRC12_003948 [Ceratobasidium sp. 428]
MVSSQAVKQEPTDLTTILPSVKHEDGAAPNLTSRDYSLETTSRSSTSRWNTPTPDSDSTTFRLAVERTDSASHRLLLRRRKIAAAFPSPRTSSRSKVAVLGGLRGTRSRLKPTSRLLDEQQRAFVKLEAEPGVDADDSCNGDPQSISSTPINSRANSEEDDISGLGREFYLGLDALRSIANLVVVSGGVHLKRGLNLDQAKNIHDQLAFIESTASGLRRRIASHFSLIATSGDPSAPSCGSSSVTTPETQQTEPDTPSAEQPNTTSAPVEPVNTPTSISNLDWNQGSSQTTDSDILPESWDSSLTQPAIYSSHDGSNGWDSTYTTPSLPTPLSSDQQGLTLPVQPLFPSTDPSSVFGARDVSGLDAALYCNTTGPPAQIDPMLDNTVGLPLNTAMVSLSNNTNFAPNLATQFDSTVNFSFDLGPAQLEEYSRWLVSSIPDVPWFDALADNPSCPSSLAPNNVAVSHSTNSAPAPQTDTAPSLSHSTLDGDPPRLPCTIEGCGKTFRRPYLLRDHMRTHSGESSAYPCTHEGCGKRFGSQSNLTRHSKTHLRQNKLPPNTPPPDAPPGLLSAQNSSTPRRSQRLQTTASNPLGPRGYRILDPRTPATINARAQKAAA